MTEKSAFSAIKGIQGGRVFFSANIPISKLKNLFEEDLPDENERSQRDLDTRHSNAIARYILSNQSSYIIGALTFALDREPEFALSENSSGDFNQVGTLRLTNDIRISSLDGQHRREALLSAFYETESLKNETVSIMLYVEPSVDNRRQMFSDMNSTSKKVSKAINILFDKRDPFAKAAKELVKGHEMLIDRVENFSGSIRGDSDKFFTLSGVKEALKNLEVGTSGRIKDPEMYTTDYLIQQGCVLFDLLLQSRPEYREGMSSRENLLKLRESSILFSSTTLRVIAGSIYKFKKLNEVTNIEPLKTSLAKRLSAIDFNKNSPIFIKAGFIKPESTTPQARNQEMTMASNVIFLELTSTD